jgi:hypothetical protein
LTSAAVRGTDLISGRFPGMADRNSNHHAPELSAQDARQGQPQGFVRYVMYTSIAAALIGMLIVYLVIFH